MVCSGKHGIKVASVNPGSEEKSVVNTERNKTEQIIFNSSKMEEIAKEPL